MPGRGSDPRLTQREWAIGLMSGTSVDGIDGVLAGFADDRSVEIRATRTQAYPAALRARLLAVSTNRKALPLTELAALESSVGDLFANVAAELTARAEAEGIQIAAIGSHGQTLFHDPSRSRESLQIGDANRIAARTGIATVADFRRRDMAEGGQGAPLVPAFHHAVFASGAEAICVANIGGIANVTLLPDADIEHVSGHDVGPGNALMDEWALQHLGAAFDRDGQWAATGQPRDALLDALLADPWFSRVPPKSTGRDEFNVAWARARYPELDTLSPADVQSTFCELTARVVTTAARPAIRLLVCGGGSRNANLMRRMKAHFDGAVETTAARGLAPEWVECAAFAWLALRRLHSEPGNLPAVTGARRRVVLGALYPGTSSTR